MKKLSLLVLAFFISSTLSAQTQEAIDRFQFDVDVNYDSSIPSPKDFLGYELGEEYTLHYQVMDYFEELARVSDKITFHEYGKTYENRALNYVVITSSANQRNIEAIQEANFQLANNPGSTQVEEQPVIVWMSYNVHGNEPSGSESAMQTAYRLVAGLDSETTGWLENSVVIIDPMLNPDGRERYVNWYKSSQANILNVNPEDLEHDEIWPGGRTNHYWFDLNRDWVWLIHPESQGRIAVYQEWMPQVHIDFHEQGFNNNYFTMPGTTPRNHELPEAYEYWADVFGRGAIEEFDRAQVNFETRERFDFFYPGYGSSYPSIMGGIGMLAEQGGHSRGGRAVETDDGYVLTLRQRVFDHYKNGVSIVKTSVENRAALLNYFKDARSQSSQKGNTQAYILPNNADDYTYDVINLMLKHNVQVEQATEDFTVRNAFDYWDGNSSTRNFTVGDFIIKTDQPGHLFINTLFRRQLEIRDSVMYDMSTWSIPLAYNLDAAWTTSNVGVSTEMVTESMMHPLGVENNDATYAYTIDWAQRHAPKALAKLWDYGYNVRSSEKGFVKDGIEFSKGSLVILIGRNLHKTGAIHRDMQAIAEYANVEIMGFDTGRMDEGSDLGSPSMEPVHEPKVALMVDSPFNSYTAGQLWFLFDQWTEFGISRIRSSDFDNIDLNSYDVILMPGSWGGLSSVASEDEIEGLKDWVRNGGVLIGTESSGSWLTEERGGIANVKLAETDDEEEGIDPAAYTRYEDREDTVGLRRIPGSAFKGIVDNSHPLAFGMPDRIYSLKFGSDTITPIEGAHNVGYYVKNAEDVLASGYASAQNKRHAAGNAFAVVDEMGQGKVVMLLDNTQYRLFWVGPARFVQNAVMLLPGF
ncbi:MAG: M14 family metallopeptidase [Balneolales bacterium]|nr:M14 family metallopeptidase [Balneolales bacterium]